MPDSGEWYEVVPPDEGLTQGDIILDCPSLRWSPEAPKALSLEGEGQPTEEAVEASQEIVLRDLIVMTQACDLENERAEDVILCSHMSVREYYQSWIARETDQGRSASKKRFRNHIDNVRKGFVWNVHLLARASNDSVPMEPRIVSFGQVVTLPREFVEGWVALQGVHRLRLRVPYREHVNQAFARYFMRVGLPNDAELEEADWASANG